jgi:hypothetical protein
MTRLLPLFLVACLVCGAAAEPIELRFDWPDGLEAAVSYSGERVREQVGQTSTQVVTGSYTLRVSNHPAGKLIEYADANVNVDLGDVAEGPQKKLQEMMIKAMSQPPSYVVNENGEYVKLHGLDDLRRNLDEMVGIIVDEMPDNIRAQVQGMFDKMLTPEVLETGIIENWNRDVGFWVGASLDVGDWYEVEFTNTVAMLGNIAMPMKNRFRIIERVACNDDDNGTGCVRIEMTSVVSDEDLAKAVEEFISRFDAQGNVNPSIQELKQENDVRLITDPSTLRPYSIESSKQTSLKMSLGGMKEDGGQIERNRLVFSWSTPASPPAPVEKSSAEEEPPSPEPQAEETPSEEAPAVEAPAAPKPDAVEPVPAAVGAEGSAQGFPPPAPQ